MKRKNREVVHRGFRRLRRAHLPLVEQIESRFLLSTFTVNTLSDSPNPGTGLMSLRKAIASANAHAGADTINFSSSVFTAASLHTIVLVNGELEFTDLTGATTVSGPGPSIVAVSGNNNSRIFDVTPAVIATIQGLTITSGHVYDIHDGMTGGFRDGFGGGIANFGTLTLNNVTVTHNSADGTNLSNSKLSERAEGGGIYSTGNLTLQNSTISFNSAQGSNYVPASAPYDGFAHGGGVYCAGSLTVTSCVITSNSVNGGDSLFRNGGNGSGGGIYAAGNLSVTSSTISNNEAFGGLGTYAIRAGSALGAGIYCMGASITSSQISGNRSFGGNVTRTARYSIPGVAYGGGIESHGDLTITSSTISTNEARSGVAIGAAAAAKGGGIFCDGSKLVLNQSTISGNYTDVQDSPTYHLYGGGNGGEADGGGIFSTTVLTATASSITGNSATGGRGSDGYEYISPFRGALPVAGGAGGQGSGGGIWSTTAVLTNCTIANNECDGGFGGAALASNPVPSNAAGAGGAADGGGIYSRSFLQIADCTVSGNIAVAGLGGNGYSNPPAPTIPPGKAGTPAGGGIIALGSGLFAFNSVISANLVETAHVAGSKFYDIAGPVVPPSAFNLIGVADGLITSTNGNKLFITNPKLMPLGDYGGPTQTMLPMAGSPVINAGSNPSGITTDQRGMPRVFGSSVDIGADEYISLTLSGTVYNDINGDGIRQPSDPGLPNWKVYIDLNNSTGFNTGEPSAITDANGNYTLNYLPTTPQSLIVREVRQAGLRRTQPAGPNPLGFYTVSPTAKSVSHLDFGNSATALISGTVFNDANGNGVFDAAEKGAQGFRVFVDLNHDGKFESGEPSVLSDASGNWSIAGLAAGSYTVHIALPLAVRLTTPPGGAFSITLSAGQFVSGKLFGESSIHRLP